MIDLILWSADEPKLHAFAQKNGLFIQNDEGEWSPRSGVAWSLWAGTGRVLQAHGEYSAEGEEINPPIYLDGTVAVVRLHGEFFEADRIGDGEGEQWERSKFVRRLHDEGSRGAALGLDFYEMDGVRIGKHNEVNAKLAEWGAPGHEFAGGVAL